MAHARQAQASMSSVLSRFSTDKQDESTLWLSAIIQELWPYAANVVQTTLKEYVEPALRAAIPQGLPTPQFTKIDVGNDGLAIEGVQVFQRSFADGDYAPVIEADIRYEGTPVIEMCVQGYKHYSFGVTNTKIKGRVEVVMRPLLDCVPLVGAMQIAFINPPKIDYTLTGFAALGDQVFIKGIMRRVVNDLLASTAVLPNRIAFKVARETSFFRFVAKPVGIFRVAALSGSGFPSTDRHVLKQAIGQSELPDVYLMLRHGATVHRTEHINNSADPVWKNQVFDFVLMSESKSQQLQIEAYDYDVGTDDFLGKQTVLVDDLTKHGASEMELDGSPEDATPMVRIAARWLPLSWERREVYKAIMKQRADNIRPKNCSSVLLSIEVDDASHLPQNQRPYLQIRVGSHVERTSASYDMPGVFSTQNPDFEKAFHIPLMGSVDASTRITYEVVDLFTGKILGHAYSPLSDAINGGIEGVTYRFALMEAEDPRASLSVRARVAAVLDSPPLWEVLANPQNLF